jgi:prophage antirepressor-like protein
MSDSLPAPTTSNTFERIKRVNQAGAEFWSARELARVLEYREFRNLSAAIAKAREACTQSGHAVSDHFVLFNEMVGIGSGAQRELEDWALSRYACYLVIQNADPANHSLRWDRPISPFRHVGRNWPTRRRCRRTRSGCYCAPR